MKTRTLTKLNPEVWPHEAFTGFDSPYSDALKKVFTPEAIAALIEKLPPESRERLEREFGPLPTKNPRP